MEDIIIAYNNIEEIIIINYFNNIAIKKNNIEGIFKFDNYILKIIWNNNISYEEKFIRSEKIRNANDVYYVYNYSEDNIILKIYHNDWNDDCIIINEYLYRKNNRDEFGKYEIIDNIITIYWEKWAKELFYKIDNIYYSEKYIKFIIIYKKTFIINIFNNKIYTKDYKIIEDESIINNFEDNNIIINDSILNEIIIFKDFEEKFIININNNEILNKTLQKCGNYKLIDNLLDIFWNNSTYCEKYKFINNKYYYINYIDIDNKEFILIDDNNYLSYRINYFNNFLYNDNGRFKFLRNNNSYYIIQNNCLNKYNFYGIIDNSCILISNKIYNNNINIININIYKRFNKDLNNMNNIELLIHYIRKGFNENRICSLETFKKKYILVNIKNEDEIINWYDNISNNIIIYDKFNKTDIYLLNDNLKKFYNNTLFIINLEKVSELENILEYISKKSYIILNINFVHIDDDNINKVKNNFENLIITKTNYHIRYYIMENIYNDIFIKKNIKFNNIIYINDLNNIEKIILNIINIDTYIDSNKITNIENKLINYVKYPNDIVQILIFYYLARKNIYELFNNNLICTFCLIEDIFDNNFSKINILNE